jgi:ABC-type multidrug transport system permease subunit
MRFLLASARKDLQRRIRDPLAFLVWIGMPLLLSVLISALSGSGDSTPTARVLLVNDDDAEFTELLVRALTRGGFGDDALVAFENVDAASGRKRIDDGKATALLTLPAGFSDALLNDEPVTLHLVTNPSETILPDIVIEGLEILREGSFYAQRILGEPLREIAAGPPPGQDYFTSAAVAGIASRINDRLISSSDLFDPPLFDVDLTPGDDAKGTDDTSARDAPFSLGRFLVPGMMLMSLLFIAQGMSDDVWREKDAGTLRRAIVAPRSFAVFLSGKLVAGLSIMAAVASLGLAVAAVFFDVAPARLPAAALWCTFSGTCLLGLFLFIAMLGTSHRTANLITMMLVFPLMMLGGSFFPFESMPAWMRAVGVWTPNGMAVSQLDNLLFGSVEPGALGRAAAVIAATGVFGITLAALRSRRFAAL